MLYSELFNFVAECHIGSNISNTYIVGLHSSHFLHMLQIRAGCPQFVLVCHWLTRVGQLANSHWLIS